VFEEVGPGDQKSEHCEWKFGGALFHLLLLSVLLSVHSQWNKKNEIASTWKGKKNRAMAVAVSHLPPS